MQIYICLNCPRPIVSIVLAILHIADLLLCLASPLFLILEAAFAVSVLNTSQLLVRLEAQPKTGTNDENQFLVVHVLGPLSYLGLPFQSPPPTNIKFLNVCMSYSANITHFTSDQPSKRKIYYLVCLSVSNVVFDFNG